MRRSAIGLILAGLGVFFPASAQTVTVSPAVVSVHLGTFYQFSVKVTGITPATVGWYVSLPPSPDGTPFAGSPGTISAGGRYTPPAEIPSSGYVIVTAASTVAVPTVFASSVVSLANPYPTLASVYPANVAVGPFTLILNGSGFVPGAQVLFGGGALTTTYLSATRLMATGTATDTQSGLRIPVAVMNPAPGPETSVDVVSLLIGTPATGGKVPYNVASRFLDQAAFGPDPVTTAHVQAVGLEAYLDEQFAAPITPYPDPAATSYGIGQVQARFFTNAVHGEDQLRQRVAFALSQIMVVSALEENTPTQLVPFLQILKKDAFANFRTLMEDVTLSPTMGEYLDMRNNDKADPARDTRANENYARELLQLFTIGLSQLHQDGTLQLDAGGNPIPTYNQATIQDFAKVYTGWTYPTKPGATLLKHTPAYYIGPMAPFESNHDTTSKTLLNGLVVPAGGTAASDLKAALDNIFSHQNVGPFISMQLIQHLVTSNPSPAYVGRVAAVFNDNGTGVRGDLQAVVKAILLDPEARAGDEGPSLTPPDTSGHLREPVFEVASILRGLGAVVNDTNNLTSQAANLGQTVFAPASVFNYFAPGYTIPADFAPGGTLLGPEFQLQSPSAAVARANMANTFVYGSLGNGALIDWSYLTALAATPQALVDCVNYVFLHGEMPGAMQTQILSAVNALTGTSTAVYKARAQAAVYLTVSSSYYNVEH
ncbi:MAG: DUF1800 domain-containing protein [Acidobacteriota bacterium]